MAQSLGAFASSNREMSITLMAFPCFPTVSIENVEEGWEGDSERKTSCESETPLRAEWEAREEEVALFAFEASEPVNLSPIATNNFFFLKSSAGEGSWIDSHGDWSSVYLQNRLQHEQ